MFVTESLQAVEDDCDIAQCRRGFSSVILGQAPQAYESRTGQHRMTLHQQSLLNREIDRVKSSSANPCGRKNASSGRLGLAVVPTRDHDRTESALPRPKLRL